MRFAVIVSILAVVLSAPGSTQEKPQTSKLPPGPARIDLQTQLVGTKRLTPYSTSRLYNIFNRPTYKGQIGTAVLIFTEVDHQWEACKGYIRLSRGTLVADSLVPKIATFITLAILGGTGYYSNVMGQLTFQPITTRRGQLTATLEAF